MAMTSVVKDELSRVPVVKPCCRKTEVSTLLRFAGGLTLTAGHIMIEAELDTAAVARRLRASIAEVFGQPSELPPAACAGATGTSCGCPRAATAWPGRRD
jgi:DNA-binding protein WhiA